MNKTSERVKTRLSDELAEFRKKFREQQRSTKEAEDKYARYKDLLVRAKATFNKVSDEISSELKRGQQQQQVSNGPKTPKVEGEKVAEAGKKSVEEKKPESVQKEGERTTEKVAEAMEQQEEPVVAEESGEKALDATSEAILVE